MNKLVRLVAWVQIISGGFMLLDVAGMLFSANGLHAWTVGRSAIIGFGTLGLVAGNALLRSSALAWEASLLLQLLQIPVFLIGAILYRPGVGAFIPLGVTLPDVGNASILFEFTLGVEFDIALDTVHGQPYVAFTVTSTS